MMSPIDLYKKEFAKKLQEGEWGSLLNTEEYSNILDWMKSHSEKLSVIFRITFYDPKSKQKHARYFICSTAISKKIKVQSIYPLVKDNPLAIPPLFYGLPLYCLPNNMLDSYIDRKKQENND